VKYLLDSNAVIGLLAGKASLTKRIRRHAPQDFGVSAIATHELFYGAFKSERKAHNLNLVEGLQFEVVEFDQDDSRQAGAIRAALAIAKTPIGPYDVLIAGQAQARDLILITRNTGEFSRVNGLRIEDWEV
jgi:tRNA(fMet)-specific endonuclease VapC